jgi:hypothetical protein
MNLGGDRFSLLRITQSESNGCAPYQACPRIGIGEIHVSEKNIKNMTLKL